MDVFAKDRFYKCLLGCTEFKGGSAFLLKEKKGEKSIRNKSKYPTEKQKMSKLF